MPSSPGAERRHDDGALGVVSDHDAGVGDLAVVGAHGDDDGLSALLAARDLDVAGVGRLGADPVGDLLAHAALDLVEEPRQGEVDVALARDLGDGEGYVVGAQAVPGLRRGSVHALELDGLGRVDDGRVRGAEGVLIVSH